MPGRTGASALLQKVNSQLRGERIPIQSKEEDELAIYLSSLTQKTQQARSTSFDDYGDISISSGKDGHMSSTPRGRHLTSPAAPGPTSKFLKKKPTLVDESKTHEDEIYDERQIIIAGNKKETASASKPASSSALNKTQTLARKIRIGSPFRRQISRDSDSESEVGRRPTSPDSIIGRDGPKFLKGRRTVDENETGVETRFPSPQVTSRSKEEKPTRIKDRMSSKARGEIVRTLGKVCLTSEEESLAEFIHGLSASESSAKKPQNLIAKKQEKWCKKAHSPVSRESHVHRSRSPSPFKRTPSPFGKRSLSQDSDLVDSLATEVMDDQRGRAASVSSEDNFHINLMDVASLIPGFSPSHGRNSKKSSSKSSKEKKGREIKPSSSYSKDVFKSSSSNLIRSNSQDKKIKSSVKKTNLETSDSKSSIFNNLGIHMVDELLALDEGKGQDAEVDLTDESDICTERSTDRRNTGQKREESDSEIITELGGSSRKVVVRKAASQDKGIGSISERIGEDSFVQCRARNPSVSHDLTGSDTSENYSDETFESDSKTISGSPSVSQRSREGRRKSTKRKISKQESFSGRDHRVVFEQKHTQVATSDATGATHHWQTLQAGVSVSGPYGLQYVDPAPVATHVISADALESITAYSPNVLALQDMMKAQLDLVRNFVSIQQRIYQSCMDGLSYEFKYTTLEETKKYIEKNRKRRLTFKEALSLVDQE